MSLTRFNFAALPVSPWRNGGGETREIVSWPPGAQDFDWRASIATIAQDGPFSAFTGIDRSITLLEGDGVRLFSAGHIDHQLDRVGNRSRSPATWRWKRRCWAAPVRISTS